MKKYNKAVGITLVGLFCGVIACEDAQVPPANLGHQTLVPFTAGFTFANATVDGGSLDVMVNGVKLGTTTPGGLTGSYQIIAIPSPNTVANTAIRANGTNGPVGGEAGTSALFRSANTGVGNFTASNGASYTVFVVDSLNRPDPLRKTKYTLAPPPSTEILVGPDNTYWNPMTKTQISQSRRDSLNPANCPACVDQTVPTTNEFANLVAMGTVPLGITDPGGIRFLVATDAFVAASAMSTNQSAIRFVNLVANSNGIAAAANANGTFGGPSIFARLIPTVGATINLTPTATQAATSNVVSNPAGFTINVGSRNGLPAGTNNAFLAQTIATAGVPITYTLEIGTSATPGTNVLYTATGLTFTPGRHYTIFARGETPDSRPASQIGKGTRAVSHGLIAH